MNNLSKARITVDVEQLRKERRKKFMNFQELQAYLGRSPTSVYRYISLDGFPKGKKGPGGRLWRVDEVEKFLDRN